MGEAFMYSEKFKTFIKMWAEEFAIQKTIDEKVCEDRDGNPVIQRVRANEVPATK